ncbi:MAG: hypothetical protein J4F34_06950 [Gemmatimonadetes bacterium]|nr:hypothetical protein [Gemmatimonadota bacterium]
MTSKVQQMAAHFNIKPITTSGYRCPKGNKKEGGVTNSWHIHGRAYDFYVAGPRWTEQLKDSIVKWARANGALDPYYKSWVHVSW